MKIQRVNCMVGIRIKPEDDTFRHSVFRQGIDAVPVTEIALMQAMNGMDSISMVSVQDEYEISKLDEYARLQRLYKPEQMALCYPMASAPMPSKMEDLDLGPEQIDKAKWVSPAGLMAADAEIQPVAVA